MGRLCHGNDLIASIREVCRDAAVPSASFSVSGSVSAFTIGTYDPTQQVYVTYTEQAACEIAACSGTVSTVNDKIYIDARILLCDEQGKVTGGRLFSDTLLVTGEIALQELVGPPWSRQDDEDRRLFL